MVNVVITGRLRAQPAPDPDPDSDSEDETIQASAVLFDLDPLARQLDNVEYHPAKFPALKLARLDPFSKGLFFESGKLVCVGNVSVALAHESIRWFTAEIARLVALQAGQRPVVLCEVVVQNIVATSRLGGCVPLIAFAKRWGKFAQYEPELFPGCPIRHPSLPSTVVVVLFSSGVMNITGAKNAGHVERAAELVARLVQTCMRDSRAQARV